MRKKYETYEKYDKWNKKIIKIWKYECIKNNKNICP